MEPTTTITLLLLSSSQLFVCIDADQQERLRISVNRHDATLLRQFVRKEGANTRVDPLILARVARAVTMEGYKLLIK